MRDLLSSILAKKVSLLPYKVCEIILLSNVYKKVSPLPYKMCDFLSSNLYKKGKSFTLQKV